jgi:hypothetical protein
MLAEDKMWDAQKISELLNQANSDFIAGKLPEAEAQYMSILEALEEAKKDDAPDIALCLQKLGDIFYLRHEYEKAASAYSRLLELGERILGSDHPDVVAMTFKLATTYDKLGLVANADLAYTGALGLAEKTLHPDQPLIKKIKEAHAAMLRHFQGGMQTRIDWAPINLEKLIKDQAADASNANQTDNFGLSASASLSEHSVASSLEREPIIAGTASPKSDLPQQISAEQSQSIEHDIALPDESRAMYSFYDSIAQASSINIAVKVDSSLGEAKTGPGEPVAGKALNDEAAPQSVVEADLANVPSAQQLGESKTDLSLHPSSSIIAETLPVDSISEAVHDESQTGRIEALGNSLSVIEEPLAKESLPKEPSLDPSSVPSALSTAKSTVSSSDSDKAFKSFSGQIKAVRSDVSPQTKIAPEAQSLKSVNKGAGAPPETKRSGQGRLPQQTKQVASGKTSGTNRKMPRPEIEPSGLGSTVRGARDLANKSTPTEWDKIIGAVLLKKTKGSFEVAKQAVDEPQEQSLTRVASRVIRARSKKSRKIDSTSLGLYRMVVVIFRWGLPLALACAIFWWLGQNSSLPGPHTKSAIKRGSSYLTLLRSFNSADGACSMSLVNATQANIKIGAVHAKMPYVRLQGKWQDFKDLIHAFACKKTLWYQESPDGLTGDNGMVLYAVHSADYSIIEKLKQLTSYAQNCYWHSGSYPGDDKNLRSDLRLVYTNPITGTGKTDSPTVINFPEPLDGTQVMGNVTNEADIVSYLEKGGSWNSEPPLSPCAIHCCVFSSKDKLGLVRITEFYAHGCDRNGRLLKGSTPGTVFVVALKNGRNIAEERSNLTRFKLASLGPATKIYIVNNPNSIVFFALRYGIQICLVIFAILFGIGWHVESRAKREFSFCRTVFIMSFGLLFLRLLFDRLP